MLRASNFLAQRLRWSGKRNSLDRSPADAHEQIPEHALAVEVEPVFGEVLAERDGDDIVQRGGDRAPLLPLKALRARSRELVQQESFDVELLRKHSGSGKLRVSLTVNPSTTFTCRSCRGCIVNDHLALAEIAADVLLFYADAVTDITVLAMYWQMRKWRYLFCNAAAMLLASGCAHHFADDAEESQAVFESGVLTDLLLPARVFQSALAIAMGTDNNAAMKSTHWDMERLVASSERLLGLRRLQRRLRGTVRAQALIEAQAGAVINIFVLLYEPIEGNTNTMVVCVALSLMMLSKSYALMDSNGVVLRSTAKIPVVVGRCSLPLTGAAFLFRLMETFAGLSSLALLHAVARETFIEVESFWPHLIGPAALAFMILSRFCLCWVFRPCDHGHLHAHTLASAVGLVAPVLSLPPTLCAMFAPPVAFYAWRVVEAAATWLAIFWLAGFTFPSTVLKPGANREQFVWASLVCQVAFVLAIPVVLLIARRPAKPPDRVSNALALSLVRTGHLLPPGTNADRAVFRAYGLAAKYPAVSEASRADEGRLTELSGEDLTLCRSDVDDLLTGTCSGSPILKLIHHDSSFSWQEAREHALQANCELATVEDLQAKRVSSKEGTDAWTPVAREDGQEADYVQLGDAHPRYVSHVDRFGQPAWGEKSDAVPWRPTYMYVKDRSSRSEGADKPIDITTASGLTFAYFMDLTLAELKGLQLKERSPALKRLRVANNSSLLRSTEDCKSFAGLLEGMHHLNVLDVGGDTCKPKRFPELTEALLVSKRSRDASLAFVLQRNQKLTTAALVHAIEKVALHCDVEPSWLFDFQGCGLESSESDREPCQSEVFATQTLQCTNAIHDWGIFASSTLAYMPKLHEITITGCGLSSGDLVDLDLRTRCPCLRTLLMGDNMNLLRNADDAADVGGTLPADLEVLGVEACGLTSSGLESLDLPRNCQRLKEIRVRSNPDLFRSEDDADTAGRALPQRLEILSLEACGLTSMTLRALGLPRRCQNLRVLHVALNPELLQSKASGREVGRALPEGLELFDSTTSQFVSSVQVPPDAWTALVEASPKGCRQV